MKVLITQRGGLGDVMATSLLSNDIGKIHKLIKDKHEVYLCILGVNIFMKEWYSWIEGLNIIHTILPHPFVDKVAYIKQKFPSLKNAEYLDLIYSNSISPIQFEYPTFDYIKENNIFVQAFAGESYREVFTKNKILSLDRKGTTFIGKSNTRICEYTNPEFLAMFRKENLSQQKLPRFKYASNMVDKLSVMETFDLLRKSKWYIGTYSSFVLPAWFLKKNTICLIPKSALDFLCNHDDPYAHNSVMLYDRRNTYTRFFVNERTSEEDFIKVIKSDVYTKGLYE